MGVAVFSALLGLLYLAHATPSKNCTFDTIRPSEELLWCPCNDGFLCSKLDVPLDYHSPYLGRASVPLVKYPSQSNFTSGLYQGMILVNPGGLGASGIEEVLEYGSTIQAVVGTNWDIVGFDPRGIYLSEPVANCSVLTTAQSNGLSSRSVPRLTDEYYNGIIDFGKELGAQCETTVGGGNDAGPHMSTATTARDMLSIVDAFSTTEDGRTASKPGHLLYYYGISYGTFLGQTFASMFPERVGNMVLDGVVNPEGYLTNYIYSSVKHLDGVIAAFFIYCYEAGPSECSYYTGSSAKDIYKRFNDSFVQLDAQKAEAENWANATDIESALLVLKVGLLTTADLPFSYFSLLPNVLLGLESAISAQDIGTWTEQAITVYGDPTILGSDNQQWVLGILCPDQDNRWYNRTLEDLRPLLEELEGQSIVGEIWIKTVLGCTGWPIKATEIFSGPFGGDTATPILFVGNTYDPVTAFDNAISSALNYKDAQALIIDGMGHTTVNSQNLCGFSKIAIYFQTGQLPGNDSFCALEAGPFGVLLNGTLKQNILQAGLQDLVHIR
ncbi:hypothetical protein VM1G_03020 [Cytospora mali]|uniref:Peptidase S33 tripeptidyl aminopeptidase-like C-terminal domain-containing protein n=1 Tax=Cytospora mali TaxID=578113 RepID=A0A194VTL9_CYTMA|nr:hypothetical protein VM1G_03020 [Valsa mali]